MGKFTISKKISLAEVLGEGHEKDYLTFAPLTFKDAKQLGTFGADEGADNATQLQAADEALGFIKTKFVGGKITDEETKEQIELTVDDFDELPMEVVKHIMGTLSGARSEGFTKA